MKGSPQTPLRRPQNGAQAHELSRELQFDRPAQLGATPFWDRRRAPFGGQKENETVNQETKSVTYVLNQECYLCIDCAGFFPIEHWILSTVYFSSTAALASKMKNRKCLILNAP